MDRIINFSAGPSVLPVSVLQKAQEELLSYHGLGLSVLEMSHRSSYFEEIVASTELLIRKLMKIPDNYKVLFVQGGASLQFSMVPWNLLQVKKHALYVNTGTWSQKAMEEASKVGEVTVIASSHDQNFSYIPSVNLSQHATADYVHITTNNTIEGTRFPDLPETYDIPLVADMSSNILSEEYDVSKFGLIYAGAQKNLGPAGVTIIIVRDDLLGKAPENCPAMLNYETYASSNSLYNTPPTFGIYITKLVLEWLEKKGGVNAIERMNREKADAIYTYLDQSNMFHSRVEPIHRSMMNIPFTTKQKQLDQLFIKEAYDEGFIELKGHRSTGGMRASLYNAMSLESVKYLAKFMEHFEEKYS